MIEMKVQVGLVLCISFIFVHRCENLKLLKKIHDFLHPPPPTTTLAPVVPTYSNGEDCRREVGTTPRTDEGFGRPSNSFNNNVTFANNYYDNEHENQHTPPNLSPTSKHPKTVGQTHVDNLETKESTSISPSTQRNVFLNKDETMQSSNNVNGVEQTNKDNSLSNSKEQSPQSPQPNNDRNTQTSPSESTTASSTDYVTSTVEKQATNQGESARNSYNQQQRTSDYQPKLTNNEQETNRNTGRPSTNPEEYQPRLDSNTQQKHTTNNQVQRNTSDGTSSKNKNQARNEIRGEIPFEEGGDIVFPTDDESSKPARNGGEIVANKGSLYAESTTARAASRAPVAVPGDGGRVVINGPSITACPAGSQPDEDGECRVAS